MNDKRTDDWSYIKRRMLYLSDYLPFRIYDPTGVQNYVTLDKSNPISISRLDWLLETMAKSDLILDKSQKP